MFEVGQMVACVELPDGAFDHLPDAPELEDGRIYTVRDVDTRSMDWCGVVTVRLEEIVCKIIDGWWEDGFIAENFRPVRKTDISELRKLVAPVPRQPVPAE